MGKLYATDESIMLAECELRYLMDLITYFERSGYYKLFENQFIELKLFRNDFYMQLDELKGLMENNRSRFCKNKKKTLLSEIYENCENLRDCFNELHIAFIKLIDKTIKNSIAIHSKKIRGSLELAENSMSNLMTNEDDKKSLVNLTDNLKVNNNKLIDKLKVINKTIIGMGIQAICKDFEQDLNQEQYDNFMKQVRHFYTAQLVDLHDYITSKFNFAFTLQKTPNAVCDEILKIRDKSNTIRYYSSYSLWSEKKKEIKTEENIDLDPIINFIKVNLPFFIAPFIHRKFQYWGQEHFEELKEISEGLKKHFNSNTLRDFYDALDKLDEDDDDGLLRHFLRAMKDTGLLEFLTHCIECPYPIIDEWNYYATFNLR